MTISLAPEVEQLIQEKVASGKYGSATEVVREALRLLEERDEADQHDLDELRREIRIGLQQLDDGAFKEYDDQSLKEMLEGIKRRGRERLARSGEEAAG